MRTELNQYLNQNVFRGQNPLKLTTAELAVKVNDAGLGSFDEKTQMVHLAKISHNPFTDFNQFSGFVDERELINWSRFIQKLKTEYLPQGKALTAAFNQLLRLTAEGKRRDSPLIELLGDTVEITTDELVRAGLPLKTARFWKKATKQTHS